jgi:dihydroflavonol-4-reductase
VVDVRDLAELHVKAMSLPETGGRRLIGAADSLSMPEMARILCDAFPDRAGKIPTRTLPGVLVRVMALFDRSVRALIPDLGIVPTADSGYVTSLTGVRFRPAREAVRAAGQSLLERGLV